MNTDDFLNRDRAFVIAEAGTCHASAFIDDRLKKAKSYAHSAARAGADCVKFQMFSDKPLFCPYEGDEQREPRWRDSILRFEEWCQVKEFAEACGIMFLGSVFQYDMVDMLADLDVKATKVASRAAKTFSYENATGVIFLSTGMEYPVRDDAIYFECESRYPSTMVWDGRFHGFSDHSGTPWRAIDAISRGCKIVEVHFYIDEMDAGPDLPASLDFNQLKTVCEARDAFAELRRNT